MLEERFFNYKLTFKVISLIRNLKRSLDPRYEEILKIMKDMQERYKREETHKSNFDAIFEGSRAVLSYLEYKYNDLYISLQKQLIGERC